MIPDLGSYDIVEVSSSGGKDSQAMVHYVAGLLRERGLLARGVMVHADLDRVEWPGAKAIAAAQAEAAGMRFVARARPQGDLLSHVERLGKWPMPTQRFCTADHKRGQILVVLGELAAEERQRRGLPPTAPVRILNCVGLRAEESTGRRRQAPFKVGARGSSSRRQIDMWLPIHGWTEAQVWRAVRASGSPVHPAYAAGLPRASCVLCIYAPRAALQLAGAAHPELLAEYVQLEQRIGHTFRRDLPIAQVAEDVAAGIKPAEPVQSWSM